MLKNCLCRAANYPVSKSMKLIANAVAIATAVAQKDSDMQPLLDAAFGADVGESVLLVPVGTIRGPFFTNMEKFNGTITKGVVLYYFT